MKISIVVPVLNEEGNVAILTERIHYVMKHITEDFEILFVDDGSTDKTFSILQDLAKKDRHIRIVKFTQNFGQTAALTAGFRNAKGEIIITMDGDLQNDPRDIPRLLEKIERGYDVVSGWRYKRKDASFYKKASFLICKFYST